MCLICEIRSQEMKQEGVTESWQCAFSPEKLQGWLLWNYNKLCVYDLYAFIYIYSHKKKNEMDSNDDALPLDVSIKWKLDEKISWNTAQRSAFFLLNQQLARDIYWMLTTPGIALNTAELYSGESDI